MKKTILKYNWLVVFLLGIMLAVSCSDLNETHLEYIKDGETIYVGKPMDVFSNSGNERIRINIIINSDPKISKGLITWNNGNEEYAFDINRTTEGIDTISTELNIAEGSYTFDIILLDNNGNSSLTYVHTALVYGEKYIASLRNRAVNEIDAFPSYAVLKWAVAEPGMLETILTYVDINDETKQITVLPMDFETILEGCKTSGIFSLTTSYKPSEDALDIFSSKSEDFMLPSEFLLEKSNFNQVILPTDFSAECWGGAVSKLWNGNTGNGDWYHTGCVGDGTDGLPHHFTIDLGVTVGLTKFRIHPRQDCCQSRNPKHFQLWGVADISDAETTLLSGDPGWEDEAVLKGWIKLLEVETDASWNGSKAPIDVTIPGNENVRYIRFRLVDTWDDSTDATALTEFTFWADEIEN